MEHPSTLVALGRGLTRRCPACGSGGIFRHWFAMEEACPRCDLRFEQEQGYWLGAVMLNTGITEGAFIVGLVVTILLTWPEVPWVPLLVVGVVTMLVLPAFLDPFTRTLWVAAERSARRWRETDVPTHRSQDRSVAASTD